jgi:hypothetical protein
MKTQTAGQRTLWMPHVDPRETLQRDLHAEMATCEVRKVRVHNDAHYHQDGLRTLCGRLLGAGDMEAPLDGLCGVCGHCRIEASKKRAMVVR